MFASITQEAIITGAMHPVWITIPTRPRRQPGRVPGSLIAEVRFVLGKTPEGRLFLVSITEGSILRPGPNVHVTPSDRLSSMDTWRMSTPLTRPWNPSMSRW